MSVRLKFRCEQVDRSGPLGPSITLTPLFISSEDGQAFFAGPPRGKVQLEGLTADAGKLFEPGQEYFIDFSPAAASAAPAETNPPASETTPQTTEASAPQS